MWSLLVAGWLVASPSEISASLAAQLHDQAQTGTLLFHQGDCLAIKVFSRSSFTHVGAVVVEQGQVVVYDAMNGSGVRKQSLEAYLHAMTPCRLHVLPPTRPMTPAESQRFVSYLEQHVGRPYAVRQYATGRSGRGLHCAEYVTGALIAAGWFTTAEPARVSPGSLHEAVVQSSYYTQGSQHELEEPSLPPPTTEETWCQSTWRETKECCRQCCQQLARWFLCSQK